MKESKAHIRFGNHIRSMKCGRYISATTPQGECWTWAPHLHTLSRGEAREIMSIVAALGLSAGSPGPIFSGR